MARLHDVLVTHDGWGSSRSGESGEQKGPVVVRWPGVRKTKPWQAQRPGAPAMRIEPPAEHTLVVFDVPADNARRKLGEMCKDYGLGRFQWSAFEGPLSRTRREELFERARRLLASAPGGGKLLVLAVAERELAAAMRAHEGGTPVEGAGGGPKEAAG